MKYQITHTTEYFYQQMVSFCHNKAMLKPRDIPGQTLLEYTLDIFPEPSESTEYTDFFGNNTTHFLIPNQHHQLTVTVTESIEKVDRKDSSPISPVTYKQLQQMLQTPDGILLDAVQFQLESPFIPLDDPDIKAYAQTFFADETPLYESCLQLNAHIYEAFEFVSGATTISTPVSEVFNQKKGVCQDFAHLALAALRSIGIPARYVSGYIETLPPEGEEKLAGVDATHAWISVYIPEMGWVDFDPTNNLIPSTQHITIGWGRDYGDIPPLKGVVYSSGISQLNVSVDMQRVEESKTNTTQGDT